MEIEFAGNSVFGEYGRSDTNGRIDEWGGAHEAKAEGSVKNSPTPTPDKFSSSTTTPTTDKYSSSTTTPTLIKVGAEIFYSVCNIIILTSLFPLDMIINLFCLHWNTIHKL